ncbi:MAG: helix-turn-helix transcriptional regulator [Actinomycetota bacterium]|nr:helix-turn-helix transcriptional regulator [Actinomycetota bacterium]
MRASTPHLRACGHVDRVFALLGKRWTGLLIDLLLQRPARYSELARAVPALSERVLAERLRELEEAGLVERLVDPGPPISVTYRLTANGERLGPAMEALRDWAQSLPPASRTEAARTG